MNKIKKLCVVVSGWHFPYGFYDSLAKQQIPKGWLVEMYVVSHRDPKHAVMPQFDPNTRRGKLDSILYKKLATIEDIEGLGYQYKEYPNTVGDWGNTNQWLEEHNYKDYDLFLFTHDDNLILSNDMFVQVVAQAKKNWLIMTNTCGVPAGSIRGSFEFFKREMLDKLGGKFDLSMTTLTREGKTENPNDWKDLYDWNSTVYPLSNFIAENDLWDRVVIISPTYRVSLYCIEGERGLISNTQALNEPYEEKGLDLLESYKLI